MWASNNKQQSDMNKQYQTTVWYEQTITNSGLIWANNNEQRCLLLFAPIRLLFVIACSYYTIVCYCLLISDRCLLVFAHIRPLFVIVCSYQTVVCYCLLISDCYLLLFAHIRPLFVIACSYQTVVCHCLFMNKQ
jgi:hypothetical protein